MEAANPRKAPGDEGLAASVVCVYNDARVLEACLLQSLDRQDAEAERLLLDNRAGRFRSAAEALNAGASAARGRHVLFVHQDVALPARDWISSAVRFLDADPRVAVAGAAGMVVGGTSNRDRGRGLVLTRGKPWAWSRPVDLPTDAQTLDECVLVAPRSFVVANPFDARAFDGWHLYGADLCLRAAALGRRVVVLPLPIRHESHGNPAGLLRYQWRLARKHRAVGEAIHTTMGRVPTRPLGLLLRRENASMLRHRFRRRLGIGGTAW